MAQKMADQAEPGEDNHPQVPYVPLSVLRKKLKMTLEAVCQHIGEETGTRPARATLSKIETGHRGASVEMLEAIATALDIDPGVIETDYEPRHRRRVESE